MPLQLRLCKSEVSGQQFAEAQQLGIAFSLWRLIPYLEVWRKSAKWALPEKMQSWLLTHWKLILWLHLANCYLWLSVHINLNVTKVTQTMKSPMFSVEIQHLMHFCVTCVKSGFVGGRQRVLWALWAGGIASFRSLSKQNSQIHSNLEHFSLRSSMTNCKNWGDFCHDQPMKSTSSSRNWELLLAVVQEAVCWYAEQRYPLPPLPSDRSCCQ